MCTGSVCEGKSLVLISDGGRGGGCIMKGPRIAARAERIINNRKAINARQSL